MRKEAFSLMEMMIVLLIVAIVAAASAPMVSRKMLDSSVANTSPWQWVGLGGKNAAFNPAGDDESTAIIGAGQPAAGEHPKLFINNNDDTPHITFGEEGNSKLFFRNRNNSIIISNVKEEVPQNAVAIGLGAQTSEKNGVVAIGNNAKVHDHYGVAIGSSSTTQGYGAISIGDAEATEESAISIGYGSGATHSGAIAIGGEGYTSGSSTSGSSSGSLTWAKQVGAIALGAGAYATGKHSIAIGSTGPGVGRTQASANNAIALGPNSSSSAENSVAIGYGARASASNQIVLGTANTTVVIPGKIEFAGDVKIGNLLVSNIVVGNSKGFIYKSSDGSYRQFDTWARESGHDRYHYPRLTQGGVSYPSWASTLSDRRLKNVGETFTDGLDKIRKIKVFNFTFKNDTEKTPRVGVMAQDLQKIFPKAVTKGEDGYLRIRMEDMFYAAINAIQELDRKNLEKDKEIQELRNQIKELEKRISKLEK